MPDTITTLAQRPELEAGVDRLDPWPAFLHHDPIGNRYWPSLFTTFVGFQLVLCDETDTVIGIGHTIPVVWDGTVAGLPAGWRGVLEQGVRDRAQGHTPTTLSALAAIIADSHRGQGL